MTLPRKLEYKDRFVFELIQSISGDCEGTPIQFPDNTTKIKFLVEMNLIESVKLLSALMTGADLSYPDESHEVVWSWLRQLECPVSLCDELIECLQPLFDAIEEKIDTLQTDVDIIQESIEESAARQPEPIIESVANAICGGATAVVDAMNAENVAVYQRAEEGFVDQVFEFIPILIELIPVFGQLPFDEMFELVNVYFENQAVDYEADYELIKDDLICDLKCFVEATPDDAFTIEVWAQWLEYVGSAYPGNRAASVFSRYAPVAQTFVNQIAALINGNQSLQAFFDEMFQVYFAGTQTPVACVGCTCPDLIEIDVVGILSECGTGDISSHQLENGETVELSSYVISGGHTIAVSIANTEDWEIEVVSVTGWTALGASDSVYGWHDTSDVFHNVLVSSGDTPEDFGTKDTHDAVFASWCATWGVNAAFFSATPFTMVMRVTRL